MSSSSIKFQLYENYISKPKEHIFRFIIGKTILQEKYYSIFSNNDNNNNKSDSSSDSTFAFDLILIISIIILSLITSIVQSIEEYHQVLLINDIVIISLQSLTLLIVSLCKRLRQSPKLPFFISWFFFLTLLIQTILYLITYSSNHSLRLLHKIYYHIIASHLIMSHIIKIYMSMNLGNLIIISVFDIFICVSINLVSQNFYYEICSIIILNIYSFVNGLKTEQVQMKVFAKYIKGKIKTKEFRDIVSGAMISVTQCCMNAQYDSMEIIQMNKIFENAMGFCIIKGNRNSNEPSNKNKVVSSNNASCSSINNNNNANVSQNLLINHHSNHKNWLFPSSSRDNSNISDSNGAIQLSSDILYQTSIDKKDINNPKKVTKGLKEAIIDYIKLDIENNYYSYLGKFKSIMGKSLYSVYIKVKHKSNEGNLFNLIFIELTNNRYEDKEKIEAIYQGLIISKISNEFKEGITSIINTVNLIKAHHNTASNFFNINNKTTDQLGLNKYNSSSSLFPSNGLITISLDMLNRITSLSDCILIIVANLVDSLKTKGKGSNIIYDENTNNDGYYNFSDLKIFLEEVVRFYIFLFHKKFNVKYEIEEAFFDLKILTNENKLKQIVSNLISNAVKHTPNNTDLSIIVNISGILNNSNEEGDVNDNNEAEVYINNNEMIHQHNTNINNIITIKLIIADQGPGVPLSILKKINESNTSNPISDTQSKHFIKASKTNANESFGKFKEYKMGLAISQKISKEIGAILSCEYIKGGQDLSSALIHGTKFILQLTTPYKRNSRTLRQTVKSSVYSSKKGAIIVNRSFKNQLYKKNKKISLTKVNCIDDSHYDSAYFSDEYISCMSQNEDYDITSVYSDNRLACHNLSGVNSHILLKNTHSSYQSIKNSSNYSRKVYNLERSKALFKSPLISRKKNMIFISPIISKKAMSKSPLATKNKSLPIYSLYRKRANDPTAQIDNNSNKKCNTKIEYGLLNSAKDQSIGLSHQSNSFLKIGNSNKSLPFMSDTDLRIMIVDDSMPSRSNIDLMIRKLCQSRNTPCSIVKFEDGAEALHELGKELKVFDHLVTKIILCGEQMKFINGSQLFQVLTHCSAKIPSLRIPFVLYSFDDQPLKKTLKETGLEFVFERQLKREDIENIFNAKRILPFSTIRI